jgi:hypothetical protein
MTVLVRLLNDVVHEVVAVPEGLELSDLLPPADIAGLIEAPDDVQEGWQFDGGNFAAPPAIVPIVTTTNSVTSAQAKIQCLRTPGSATGKTLLDDITAAVQAQGGEAQIWFTEARTWERSNPYVTALSKGLKLTSDQVNKLFNEAAQIAA